MKKASIQNLKHIYVHYPYCLYKCHYCDFNSYAYKPKDIPEDSYVKAVIQDLKRWHSYVEDHTSAPIETIFLGGGTPSLMTPSSVEKIISAISQFWSLSSNPEITLEANPGTVDLKTWQNFKLAGVNRVSMGVQSLAEKNLARFGRIHSAKEALLALEQALQVFDKVSADLIYGFPEQTLKEWQSDLNQITEFSLKHISCYALTAEPHTQYSVDLKRGHYKECDPDDFADFQNWTYDFLQEQGFSVYEISNFAKQGEESQHNLGYWRYHSYIGVGAGAVSHLVYNKNQVKRYQSLRRPDDYKNSVGVLCKDLSFETILSEDILVEYFMMNFRRKEGVSEQSLNEFFGEEASLKIKPILKSLVKDGFLTKQNDSFAVTRKGFLLNHQMLSRFFL